jgi:glycerol-3-phosphate dehydrogenase
VIEEQESGLLSLMGGKWTTYRRMGEDLVDLIARREEDQGLRLPGSRTAGLKLLGSAP